MEIRFWGVRGSIASPGADTARGGGNTSSVEVVCGGSRIVLDAGTGLRGLGNAIAAEAGPASLSVLLSHFHWDVRSPIRGVLQALNREEGGFDEDDERYIVALSTQLARVSALTTLRAADAKSLGVTLRGPYNRIIGTSAPLAEVYERARRAAETDATVLFRGETGTGKGLFARAIHVNSKRQAGPFVTVDCTTLPSQLVESELFGHERGAFTSADRRVLGKVEIADHGTMFLDEIGDLPLEIQGKLLRLLEDRAFERVGGRTTILADVRIVCATHRDLKKLAREGRFREDLYYRVKVVEIELPALRTRGGDEIEQLARHFAEVYARRYERPDPTFTTDAMARLRAHSFPGNVRELEHWWRAPWCSLPTVESTRRTCLRSRGPRLRARAGLEPFPWASGSKRPTVATRCSR